MTAALCAASPGQLIGVRGPYGTDWDLPSAAGRDLVIVAGGIGLAPLRPAVVAALASPAAFRRILILIGARSPAELVFASQLDGWRERGADVRVTVDRASSGWTGNVGLVTQLIDRADLDPAQTTAMVCGPELMMRLSAQALVRPGGRTRPGPGVAGTEHALRAGRVRALPARPAAAVPGWSGDRL